MMNDQVARDHARASEQSLARSLALPLAGVYPAHPRLMQHSHPGALVPRMLPPRRSVRLKLKSIDIADLPAHLLTAILQSYCTTQYTLE